jgi:hypothetical protein
MICSPDPGPIIGGRLKAGGGGYGLTCSNQLKHRRFEDSEIDDIRD